MQNHGLLTPKANDTAASPPIPPGSFIGIGLAPDHLLFAESAFLPQGQGKQAARAIYYKEILPYVTLENKQMSNFGLGQYHKPHKNIAFALLNCAHISIIWQ